jgi:hypothetical protein
VHRRRRRFSRIILFALLFAPFIVDGSSSRAATDPVIAAAGDIACAPGHAVYSYACQQAAVADLIEALKPVAVLALGDEQYPCGAASEFAGSYDKSWGKLKSITRPVPGNHEYNMGEPGAEALERDGTACEGLGSPSDAAGYYGYFKEIATPRDPKCRKNCEGYYSFDIGKWHIIALNSNCEAVACKLGSKQEEWLEADLAKHPAACTLAYWHHPRFSSGISGGDADMATIWRDLYRAGVDVVLAGHDHDYERFAPLDADGFVDKQFGIREFVVGTGGVDHHDLREPLQTGSEKAIPNRFGPLTLTLHPDGYDWAFNPIDGPEPLDSGHASCHGAPTPAK